MTEAIMTEFTVKKGNKTGRISGTPGEYKVIITQDSDISSFGDVLITRRYKTLTAAKKFINKEIA